MATKTTAGARMRNSEDWNMRGCETRGKCVTGTRRPRSE